jgi:hypothetical protein
MRKHAMAPLALLVGGLTLAACAEGTAPSTAGVPTTRASVAAEPSPAGVPSRRPAGSAPPLTSPKAPAPAQPTAKPAQPPPGQPVRPSPRPFGPSLTGTVQRAKGCTTLQTATKRYALSGAVADSLTVGAKVTVTANAAAMPASCEPGLTAVLVVTARPVK